jgi:hypothetical protein
MKLFRRNSKSYRFVVIKGGVIRVYLGYNIVDIQKRLKDIASLIKEMPRKTTADSTHCSENNDVDHISEDGLDTHYGQTGLIL